MCTSLWRYMHMYMHIYMHIYVHICMHIFIGRSRVSKSRLEAELCFHRYMHFFCVPIYIFGFHHKQCASD